MLADIKFNNQKALEVVANTKKEYPDYDFSEYLNPENVYKKVSKGIYSGGLNFQMCIRLFSDNKIIEDLYSFSPRNLQEYRNFPTEVRENYGVCDNYEQILKKYPELITSDKKFVVSIAKIRKSDQSPTGGWRWHKWGAYIGTQKPTTEYLYNEELIEEVLVFHIYEIE